MFRIILSLLGALDVVSKETEERKIPPPSRMGAVKAIGITTAIGGILGILLGLLLPLRPDETLGFLVVLTLGGTAIGVILSAVGALSYRMDSKTDDEKE